MPQVQSDEIEELFDSLTEESTNAIDIMSESGGKIEAEELEDGLDIRDFSLTVRELSDNGLIKYHTKEDGSWEYRLSDVGEKLASESQRQNEA